MKNVRIAANALLAAFLLPLIIHIHAVPSTIKIGAIFHGEARDEEAVFEHALRQIRRNRKPGQFVLDSVIKWVKDDSDGMSASVAACELVMEGVAAIFGPKSSHMRPIVSNIAARHDIPHIEYAWRSVEESILESSTTNFYPPSKNLSRIMAEFVTGMNWNQFTFIYEEEEALSRIQETLQLHGPSGNPVTVRQISGDGDNSPLLKQIAVTNEVNIIVDVDPKKIIKVLNEIKMLKLMKDYHTYIISGLDFPGYGLVANLSGNPANITGFGLLTEKRELLKDVLGNTKVTIEAALLYDSVIVFNNALATLHWRNAELVEPLELVPTPLICGQDNKYSAGQNLTQAIRSESLTDGISGVIEFDETGQRQIFRLNILEFQTNRIVPLGVYDREGMKFTRSELDREKDLQRKMKSVSYIVTTRVGPPFLKKIDDNSPSGVVIDGERYDGYSVDLIKHIAEILNISYTFELVPDGKYGSYNEENKSWDGLIQRLRERKAHLAICDMTINHQRKQAVDFTMPFMNLGISILFSKPPEEPPELFSFLSPFTDEVWIFVATAYLIVSIALFVLARVAPGEWDNPHPCNHEPEELENSFNLMNSFWLTIGSLMQQGSDILPKAPSIRMLAGMWWFFVLIMVSSYTANLAAFLTANKMGETVSNAEELAAQKKIKYGAVEGGSTWMFFKDSNDTVYQRMWAAMNEAGSSVFTKNNDEGVNRVLTGKQGYAFIMESTAIEYNMQRNCNLIQIGSKLDSKGYGIAMPLNAHYRSLINKAVLTLQEKGTLGKLKDRWWKDKVVTNCSEAKATDESSEIELSMENVGGVFVVLMLGCTTSFIVGILEFLWNVRKVAVEEMVTPWEALMAELKFAVNFSAETKPVKVARSSGRSSNSAFDGNTGIGRAASVARSMVGSFLRLDILEKSDKDNNHHPNSKTGNHTNDN